MTELTRSTRALLALLPRNEGPTLDVGSHQGAIAHETPLHVDLTAYELDWAGAPVTS